MIRHYESLGLLAFVYRSAGGYRLYQENEVHTLRFIKRARELGFSLDAITELVNLWQNQQRSSAQVKTIAETHLMRLRERIDQLQAMERSLVQMTDCCQGNERPECPILDDLAGRMQKSKK